MYVSEIALRNVRRFDKLKITINRLGGSVVIAGDNGAGKTSILRSIAMGLCDETSAAGLLRELPGQFVRNDENEAEIRIELTDQKGRLFRTVTAIKRQQPFEQIKQGLSQKNGGWKNRKQNEFPWKQIFVCGYGAGRTVSGSADPERYRAVDAVYTLFRYYDPLQNPELALRRIMDEAWMTRGAKQEKRVLQYLLELIARVLMHDKGKLFLKETGIRVRRPWGDCDIRSSGDGYSAMTTLVLDLINWYMLAVGPYRMLNIVYRHLRANKAPDHRLEVSGIVLIDEIEQHLHPVWQVKIMELLTSIFPKIQFIATTHSPLVQSGCAGLKLVDLKRPKENQNVYGWLAEDVYRKMGLDSTRAVKMQKLIKDYREIHFKSLSGTLKSHDRAEMKKITAQFKGIPGMDATMVSTELRNIGRLLPSNK